MTPSGPAICVACGGLDSRVFWFDPNRTIRQCRSCGLLFVFPQTDRATLHSQFQSDYFTHGKSAGPTRLELEFEAWRGPALTRIVQRIRALKPAGKLLDVGCASGEIFEHFRESNWELYGIEPSAMAFARAHERFGGDPRIQLFNGYLRDVRLEPKSVDVITVLESLYYMPNPRHELSHIARMLKDDGLLAIAVPGYAYQRLRYSGPISYLLDGSRCSLTTSHLFYFTVNSMTELLRSQGFRIFETLQLDSSANGNKILRIAHKTYRSVSGALDRLTWGHINLAPHVLYLCQKSD